MMHGQQNIKFNNSTIGSLISVDSQYAYNVHGISDPLRWRYMDSKWWAISTQLTQCNIPTEQKSVLKRIRSLGNHISYLLLRVGANVSVEVNIICSMNSTCNHLHTPTYAHNKLVSYTETWTLLCRYFHFYSKTFIFFN